MLKYINQEEYKKLLGTENVPNNFNKLVIEASEYINHNTFGRIDKNNIPEQVKYVTCLIIDLIKEQGDKIDIVGNLKSQEIEGWKETYSAPEEIKKNYDSKKHSILQTYLWNVIGTDGNSLLYCGVC
ncbi:MAG: hypothetical protein HFJ53_01005 [Clostridia bacterium]|nr:hypothetical protein [Clostridia bacterium]